MIARLQGEAERQRQNQRKLATQSSEATAHLFAPCQSSRRRFLHLEVFMHAPRRATLIVSLVALAACTDSVGPKAPGPLLQLTATATPLAVTNLSAASGRSE